MEDAVRLLYGASHVIALVVWAYTGFWRRYPVCFLLIALTTIFKINYSPQSPEWVSWVSSIFVQVGSATVAFRFFASVEALHRQADEAKLETEMIMIIGLCLAAVSVTATIWEIEPGTTMEIFIQVRRYVQIATAVFMLAGVAFLWSQHLWQWTIAACHTIVVLALTVKQAVYSLGSIRGLWPNGATWAAADWPGLLVSSLCCLAWTTIAVVYYRRRAQ